MEYRGFVRGFSKYTQAQLMQMKTDLSLEMSLSLLTHCTTYYKQMRRDPAIAELQLLDRYYQSHRRTPSTCAITELLVDQEFIAQTYHDLLKKRAELLGNTNHPCTPAEAFYAATAYIGRGGKSAQLPSRSLSLVEAAAFFGAEDCKDCVISPKEDSYLQITAANQAQAPGTGDMLILLTSGETQTRREYLRSVSKLLSEPTVRACLIAQVSVTQSGILDAALTVARNGLWIELSRLAKVEEYVPTKMLFKGYAGDQILRLSAKAPGVVAKIAATLGLRASIVATVTNDGDLRISNQGSLDFRVSLPFLHSFSPIRGVNVKLSEESTAALNIRHERNQKSSLAYLPYLQDTRFSTTCVDGTITAVSQTSPAENFFLHGVYTVLTSAFTLALSGCNYPRQRLALRLQLPADLTSEKSVGELMSMILGVYRAQAEYGIPAATLKMIPTEQGDHPDLTVYSTSEGAPCPARFISQKNRVYLLRIANAENGAPDFAEIRKCLSMVSELRRRGVLQSAKILCNQSLTQGLEEMGVDGIRCHVQNMEIIAEDREYFSVLLETTQVIPAIYLGRTEKTEKQAFEGSALTPCSVQHVWAEQPEIVILSKPGDPAVDALVSELEKEGAHVQAFSDAPSNANAFSRALLGSHVLILGKKAEIAKGDAVEFAYQTFRTAQGKVISMDDGESSDADFFFPKGFAKADILKICSIEEKK